MSKENEILSEELAKLAGPAGGLGAGMVAKFLPEDAFEHPNITKDCS